MTIGSSPFTSFASAYSILLLSLIDGLLLLCWVVPSAAWVHPFISSSFFFCYDRNLYVSMQCGEWQLRREKNSLPRASIWFFCWFFVYIHFLTLSCSCRGNTSRWEDIDGTQKKILRNKNGKGWERVPSVGSSERGSEAHGMRVCVFFVCPLLLCSVANSRQHFIWDAMLIEYSFFFSIFIDCRMICLHYNLVCHGILHILVWFFIHQSNWLGLGWRWWSSKVKWLQKGFIFNRINIS